MDAFSYLTVLISIVVGLALAHLLGGFAAMVRARTRIAIFWPLVVQMALLFLVQVQMWWAFFSLRGIGHWNFPEFLIVLMQAVFVYLATAFLVPELREEGRVDLKQCYYREVRWYFGALFLAVLDSFGNNLLFRGGFQNRTDLAGHAVFMLICITAIATQNERVHKLIAVLALVIFASYIALLFVPLPH